MKFMLIYDKGRVIKQKVLDTVIYEHGLDPDNYKLQLNNEGQNKSANISTKNNIKN